MRINNSKLHHKILSNILSLPVHYHILANKAL